MKLLTLENYVLENKNIVEQPKEKLVEWLKKLTEYAIFLQSDFKVEWFIGDTAIFKNVEMADKTKLSEFYTISGEHIFTFDKSDKTRIYWHYDNLSELLLSGSEIEVVDNYVDLIGSIH